MLTVHHLGVSQSDRIVWLCEELELPYELIRYQRDPVTRFAPDDYRALHPFGTAPIITDGGLVLSESAAIIDYVIALYGDGRLKPAPRDDDFADYLFWFHFANGSFMPGLMVDMVADALAADAAPDFITLLRDRTRRAFDLAEARLATATWFAGDRFTAADIMMLFPLTTMRHFAPRDLSPYPAIRAYLRRVGERPSFRMAMERADPGMAPLLD